MSLDLVPDLVRCWLLSHPCLLLIYKKKKKKESLNAFYIPIQQHLKLSLHCIHNLSLYVLLLKRLVPGAAPVWSFQSAGAMDEPTTTTACWTPWHASEIQTSPKLAMDTAHQLVCMLFYYISIV